MTFDFSDEEPEKFKFTALMEVEKDRLYECCKTWKKCLEDAEDIPEDGMLFMTGIIPMTKIINIIIIIIII